MQMITHIDGSLHYVRERHAFARIEIKNDPIRMQRIRLGRAPSVQLDRRDLRHGDQPIGIVDRKIGRPRNLSLTDRRRQRAMTMFLEKMFASDAFRTAHDGKRPMRQPWQRMCGDRLPVFRKVLLGDARPQLAIGVRQRDAADSHAALFRRTRCHDVAALLRRRVPRSVAFRRNCYHRSAFCRGCFAGWLSRTDHSSLRIRIGRLTHNLGRRLVLARTEVDRVTHAPRPRP